MLIRNEILFVSSSTTQVILSNKYLKAVDSDTSSANLRYLVMFFI